MKTYIFKIEKTPEKTYIFFFNNGHYFLNTAYSSENLKEAALKVLADHGIKDDCVIHIIVKNKEEENKEEEK